MSEPLSLRIEAGGLEIFEVLDQLSGKMGDVAKQQENMAQAVLKLVGVSDKLNGSIDRQSSTVDKAVNPWERLAKAQERHAEALKGSDYTEIKMAELRLAKAEESARRADNALMRRANPTAWALQDMIMTSRFNLPGVGLMPLVSKASAAGILPENFVANAVTKLSGGPASADGPKFDLSGIPSAASAASTIAAGSGGAGGGGISGSAFGAVSKIPGVGLIVAGLVAGAIALKVFTSVVDKATNSAARNAAVWSGASFAGGGTVRPGLGLSPSDFTQMARSFAGAINDPNKVIALSQMGINPNIGGIAGSQNYGATLLQVLRQLSSDRFNDKQALRLADLAGVDPFLVGRLRNTSAGVRNMAGTLTPGEAFSGNPEISRRGNDFNALTDLLKRQASSPFERLGQELLPGVNEGLKALNGALYVANVGFEVMLTPLKQFNGILAAIGGLFGKLTGQSQGRLGDGVGANAQALDRNTKAIEEMTTGMTGWGAQSANDAIPRGVRTERNAAHATDGQRRMFGGIPM